MNKNIYNKIKAGVSTVQMSTDTKERIKSSVLEYAKMNPVAVTTQAPKWYLGLLAQPRFAVTSLIAVLVFGSSGGVAFASQYALPGDRLYDIKLATEHVVEAVAFTQAQHNAIATKYAARRIAELDTLIAQKKVTTATQEKLLKKASQQLTKIPKETEPSEQRRVVRRKILQHSARLSALRKHKKEVKVAQPLSKPVQSATVRSSNSKSAIKIKSVHHPITKPIVHKTMKKTRTKPAINIIKRKGATVPNIVKPVHDTSIIHPNVKSTVKPAPKLSPIKKKTQQNTRTYRTPLNHSTILKKLEQRIDNKRTTTPKLEPLTSS